jgi:hypothetical protein
MCRTFFKKRWTIQRKTSFAVFIVLIVQEPFVFFLNIFPLLIKKECAATTAQITFFAALLPILPICASYCNTLIQNRGWSIKRGLLLTGLASRIPWLFLPWIESVEGLIIALGVYHVFEKANHPLWIEAVKRNLPPAIRSKAYSFSMSMAYLLGALCAVFLAPFLDIYPHLWKMFSLGAVALSLISLYVQLKLPIDCDVPLQPKEEKPFWGEPWKNMVQLFKENPSFFRFQSVFMCGGFALMLFKPALPIFLTEVLSVSYTEFSVAKFIYQAMGFCLASFYWSRAHDTLDWQVIMRRICLLFALFHLLLYMSISQVSFLYLAYLIYGIAQGGSKLIWNLSGPMFSKEKDSTNYSRVNTLLVGIRGMIAPLCGALLYSNFSMLTVLFCAGSCSLLGAYLTRSKSMLVKT